MLRRYPIDTDMAQPPNANRFEQVRHKVNDMAQKFARAAAFGAAAGLVVLVTVSCSALPVIVPDMSLSPHRPKIAGAQGPMSPTRSREILSALEGGARPTHIFDRHLAREQAVADRSLIAGNRVRLLQNGPETYRAMFAAIDAARASINLETYILDDDEVGHRFVDALIVKQRAGVQVNLIYDGVGAISTPSTLFQSLRDNGVRTLEFNPVNPLVAKAGWDVNHRDHRKLLIVDGRTAFLGGINVSGVYSGGSLGRRTPARPSDKVPWRDTDVQIDGPVVAEFQMLFVATWAKQHGETLAGRAYFPPLSRQGDEVMRAIGTSPDDAMSRIYVTLLSAIESAETEILLTNAYFVPDPQLLATLIAAAARGVDVRMVLPGGTDSVLVFNAGRSHYDQLLKSGVKVYERQGALMHAKTAVIDGVWSTVGSTNLDWRSFLHNDEVNAVVLGSGFGNQMRSAFVADVAQSKAVTLEDWRQRPLSDRVKEAFSRLWQYWL